MTDFRSDQNVSQKQSDMRLLKCSPLNASFVNGCVRTQGENHGFQARFVKPARTRPLMSNAVGLLYLLKCFWLCCYDRNIWSTIQDDRFIFYFVHFYSFFILYSRKFVFYKKKQWMRLQQSSVVTNKDEHIKWIDDYIIWKIRRKEFYKITFNITDRISRLLFLYSFVLSNSNMQIRLLFGFEKN